MSISYRLLRQDDLETFSALLTRFLSHAGNDPLTDDQTQRLFAKAIDPAKNYFVFTAHESNAMVGMLSLTFGESSYQARPFAYGDDLFVDEDQRGRGLARQLVQEAATLARERGCSCIMLGVGEDEEGARAFYERNGFINLKNTLYSLPLQPDSGGEEFPFQGI